MNKGVTPSSGNVFADLDFPDADDHRRKAWIVVHIGRRMKAEGLTETRAAERTGLKRQELAAVLHGRFRSYSLDYLACCLSALGGEVQLSS